MSLDERQIVSEDLNSIQALALTQANTLSQSTGSMARLPQDISVQSGGIPDLTAYLHAFRRNWLLALGLGLLFAALAGPAVWFSIGAWYSATFLLRVAYQEKALIYSNAERLSESEYDIFKNTQVQLLLGRFVLTAALKKPEGNPIYRLPILKEQNDPVGWLTKKLSVSFPGKSEIMEIRLTTTDRKEAAQIVSGVVEAYMSEVVDVEKAQRRDRVSELDRLFTDKEQEVRNRRSELKQLAEQLGTAETENLNLRQRLTLEELATYRQELARSEFEVGRLRSDLASRRSELDSVNSNEISDLECEMFAQNDQVLRNLIQEIMYKKMDSQYTSGVLKDTGKKSNKFIDKYQPELDRIENDYKDRMDQVRMEIKHKRQVDVEKDIKRVEAAIDIANKQQKANVDDVQRLRKLAEQFGSSSVDVEMLRNDIANREKSLESIRNEREKLKVELRAASRVTPLQRKAEEPLEASNYTMRVGLTVVASLLGLCLPAGGIIWWDTSHQRINTSKQVSDRLGISVIGSMPIIPSRVLRHLGSPSKRNQHWQLRLTESVDGISARLLRRADLEQRRVVMVTSAVSGEGKTTLAAQLAMSLARAGRRTVLVDFDLRQPSFDDAFGLARSPGVSEILRNESDLDGAVQQTQTANLAVITAGRWNRIALSALANGAAYSLFKELRDDYEFVVVDTSPILPIADARFVSQYVDSVVFCVFRDISEAPRILAACEILEAFGVQCIEAVVTGASEKDTGRAGYYHSSVSA